MSKALGNQRQGDLSDLKTLSVRKEGAVLFVEISAPPMNLSFP